jgi:radical SAM protein with 4Fe4S-binding SPASM domain
MNKITSPPKREIFKQDEWYVFYDPVNVKWVKVNEAGKEIIQAIEENPTLEKAVLQLKQKYHQVEETKIYQFIDYLIDHANYLHKGEYQKREINFNRENVLPVALYLHPTYNCNLDCVYCYNKDDRDKHIGNCDYSELTRQDYENLFKEIKELGITSLIFSGGEPLLRKDIFEIANISKALGLHNAIITNGTLISLENAQKIIDHFDQISISIDSFREEENDVMRGKGSFQEAMKGIHALRSLGASVSCLGVAHKHNLDSIMDSWDYFVNQLGCTSFLPQLFIPSHEKLNTDREIEDFVLKYSGIRNEINMLNKTYSQVQIKDNCGMCAGELAIGADGGVFPCQSLLKEEFWGGNIRNESLKNILENSPVLKKLREFSVDDIEICCDCDIKYLCAGGCRAFHYEIYRDLKKTDTRFCPINHTITTQSLFESAVHSSQDVPEKETTQTKTEPTCL